ncbi:uncharacterized protein LOC111866687 [Cryptotermes secundus]|uniref:uncharacterized protein LOC111866687 n=1 Tax=Cryptotermes secundus TaxID=105785 RepID=UPI000CD7D93C|nr:uncharacterized protein LOC111866687 [Cryptotermes secundus]
MPRIVAQRAEEIFPAVREGMNYANLENVLVGPHGEMYTASHHANETVNVKIEGVSVAAEEEDPLRIAVQEIKAEPESYSNSKEVLLGPYSETYPGCHDGDQAMNMKAEEVSDAAEEGDIQRWQLLSDLHLSDCANETVSLCC